ncbi:DUF871 domain-containing protein [Alteribacter populi]|uniref:DUF871 domain-containing protein n=1 Tax=Alteribacter populi TaxID=2011011 RepID=UPI000BBB0184|nr:MupG family TIM beta-alpha barrel fold protein [Alteribacter populi]
MKGVSVFLGQQSQRYQEDYLKRMKQAGFRSVFTSLHIPEDDPTMYINAIEGLGQQTKELEMGLIADVSPASLSHLHVDLDNLSDLLQKGITGLRVDYGFDAQSIVNISKEMTVCLNASTLTQEFIDDLFSQGLVKENSEVWHNYYPRPETGLDKEAFIKTNKWLHSLGFTTMAFVPGDLVFRGPLQKGLPTLEKHRTTSPFAAAKELWDSCEIDHVFIGDPEISQESSEIFRHYQDDGVVTLRAAFSPMTENEKTILNQEHRQRLDPARDVIRSETSRSYAQKGKMNIQPADSTKNHARMRGSITIDNAQYGRYQGELQIVKSDLPADSAVNLIGHVVKEDLLLIDCIQPGERFVFKLIE